jgi:PEP-CTERM motif-containing protein
MCTPLKRLLFFLLTVSMLRASPALSVPLASAVDGPEASVSGPYDPYRQVAGESDEGEAKARIVDRDELGASGHSGSPGWLKPAAAVGAGSALYVLFAGANKHEEGATSSGFGSFSGDAPSGGMEELTLGGGRPGGDDPPSSAVPEPGTIAMLGIGIASLMGRMKLARRT